ncbi:hypothetical protein DFH29DRAFT_932997 [Suillus ampliporus]|nr:hypothetical protein DFH29DRAFT_932997 [Suillus ampliporus]
MTMAIVIGLLSLPIELICQILFLLDPRDLSRCAITCKTVRAAALNSVDIQYKLELYAQGFAETSYPKLDAVTPVSNHLPGMQYVKCGIWWIWENDNIFIRDWNTNCKLSHSWSKHDLFRYWFPRSLVIDPLQDLAVVVPIPGLCTVTETDQDYHVFSVEFRLASSLLPHPDSVDASLKCNHTFDESSQYRVALIDEPAICGDRIVILYYTVKLSLPDIVGSNAFIQVIDWRKGHAKSYPLCEDFAGSHLVDEQKVVVIDTQGVITLYTLQEHGPPQRRIMYRLLQSLRAPFYQFHATPSFHSATARPDLIPGYVPSPESQIIVLEARTNAWPIILVIDMVIFSGKALYSEIPVEIPWSDWGPQYTCCFPHHSSHKISVFGSKMAYALPQDGIPELGQRLQGLSTNSRFYVHILDFNKRAIARAENMYDTDSPHLPVRKPDYFDGAIISNHPYTATVCRTPFSSSRFDRLFLEHDRLTLTWLRNNTIRIRVVSPLQMDLVH